MNGSDLNAAVVVEFFRVGLQASAIAYGVGLMLGLLLNGDWLNRR